MNTGVKPNMAQAAQALLDVGFSVIPVVPGGKKVALNTWKELQTRRTTPAEIYDWWGRHPEANLAIVTGAISGIVVLDVDAKRDGFRTIKNIPLPPTVAVRTPGGGLHLYYQHPGGHIPNRVDWQPGIDVRGDGGYVVAPPSEIEGRWYTWLNLQEVANLLNSPQK